MKSKRNIKSRKGRKGRRTRKIGGTALFKGFRNGIKGAVNRVKKRVMGKVVEVNGEVLPELVVNAEVTNNKIPEDVKSKLTNPDGTIIISYTNNEFKYVYNGQDVKKIEIINYDDKSKEHYIAEVIIITDNKRKRTSYVPKNDKIIINVDKYTITKDITMNKEFYKITEIRTDNKDGTDTVQFFSENGTPSLDENGDPLILNKPHIDFSTNGEW